MLAQLLSSKPKSRIVNLFLAHPGRSFSFTELRASTEAGPTMLQQTLKELLGAGFLIVHAKEKNKYFQVDKHFALFPELVSLLRKVKKLPPDLLIKEALKMGDTKFLALTGIFAGRPRTETDLLIVGKIKPSQLTKFLVTATKFAEREVTYTVFTSTEFDYRKIMNDRFVKNILENGPVIVVDKAKKKLSGKLVYKGWTKSLICTTSL